MSTLINKFLLVGPWNSKLKEIGSVIAKDLYEANYHFERSRFDVLGVNLTSLLEKKFTDYIAKWKQANPYLQIVAVISQDFSKKQLIKLQNEFSFFKIFYSYQDPEIEHELYLTLEKAHMDQQIENYKALLEEQNKTLQKLKHDLEEKIEKRTKFLTESRRKLFLTNFRIETFRKTLTAIYKSNDIIELEENLNKELLKTFEIQWIKIFYHPEDKYFLEELKQKLDYDYLKFPVHRQHSEVGSVFFMKTKIKPFQKEESDFFIRITEAVSLALERIEKLYKIEIIKNHWETTFNAIKEPVVLLNNNYEVIQSNLPEANQGLKCYQLLFNTNSPCKDCERGQNFNLDQNNDHYEVLSQNINIDKQDYFINYYSNTNEKLKLETKILLMAPEAELGIISSSLAHEMNNPLAGLLSFTQLMLMDLKFDDPLYQDLKEIETAAKRTRDIIDNLLIFSRFSTSETHKKLNLFDMIEKAFQLFHLQKQNKNFTLKYNFKKDVQTLGSSILVIQFFLDLFLTLKNFTNDEIEITGSMDQNFVTLSISLNEQQSLTEALKIVEKYGFSTHSSTPDKLMMIFPTSSVNSKI